MKPRLLCVGKEPARLKGSPRYPDLATAGWDVAFAETTADAQRFLPDQALSAVLADVQLPDGSGIPFLDQVMKERPAAHRFLLANLADRNCALKGVGTAHVFLSTPCDVPKLLAAIERARQADLWLGNEAVRKILAQNQPISSPPAIYFKIVKEVQSATASLESVGSIIARDPALSSKLLQLVNSAMFGLRRQVSSPREAVMYLGIETTKSLVLLAHSYSHFDHLTAAGFSVETLWRHSLQVARYAKLIAELQFAGDSCSDQSFTAGLLHDLGKLVLASYQPATYKTVTATSREKHLPLWECEQTAFGTNHAEVSACLASTWALPLPIIEALALHHHPSCFLTHLFSPLTAVHAANIIHHEEECSREASQPPPIDEGYLDTLGLKGRIALWRQACRQASVPAR